MEDLSLHILDIVENAVAADADRVKIIITEDSIKDRLTVEIIDNGKGMDEETARKALDPFFTTRSVRRVGLGLSLLSEAAKAANGKLSIKSKPGEGTRVKADFQLTHIDRQPLGDIGQTILTLIAANPDIQLTFMHTRNGQEFCLDTKKLKARLKGASLNSPQGIKLIRQAFMHHTSKPIERRQSCPMKSSLESSRGTAVRKGPC